MITLSQVSLESRSEMGGNQRVPEQGEVLVTLLPVNERLPWVTPARFRPELVPEELMTPALTVRIQFYNHKFLCKICNVAYQRI